MTDAYRSILIIIVPVPIPGDSILLNFIYFFPLHILRRHTVPVVAQKNPTMYEEFQMQKKK